MGTAAKEGVFGIVQDIGARSYRGSIAVGSVVKPQFLGATCKCQLGRKADMVIGPGNI